MNLKEILMLLGNGLVTEHQFAPAGGFADPGEPSTQPITDFTEWLNNCPEAQRVLEGLGVQWPV